VSTALAPYGLHLVEQRPPGPGLTDFGFWLRARGCSKSTVDSRLSHMADFARQHPSFPNVSSMHISAWLGRPEYAAWTRSTYFGHLRSFFTFAMENDLLAVDPMRRMRRPKPPRGIPRPLTPAQVHHILSVATNANLHAWLTLAFYAGLRAHEIAKIRGEDVEQDQLFVLGKGSREAHVPCHPLVWALAQTRPRHGWWFPTGHTGGAGVPSACGHVTAQGISTMTSRLFAANGIEGSIHRCRHTYATELLRGGANVRVVQTLMRHESLDSTMVYTDVSEDERMSAICRLPEADRVIPRTVNGLSRVSARYLGAPNFPGPF
jgi:integrase/recombinase XerD